SLTNSLDTRNHLKIRTTFSSGQPGRPHLCINKLAPSVGPSTRGYSEKECVMANTTPLVTTVMKPTNNPGEANTAPRVNIQELCEEYYEDILPIIMEKARHERLKDVHASSPNLEKLRVQQIIDDEIGQNILHLPSTVLFTSFEEYQDIWLGHLKELEVTNFNTMTEEWSFLKLILAKSPMLKK
nr:hypothetical protein [Tanacetum cinerariifolium]